jgi:hypothetical protein
MWRWTTSASFIVLPPMTGRRFEALSAMRDELQMPASGQSRLRWSRPRLVHVRFNSDSDRQPSKRDPALRANQSRRFEPESGRPIRERKSIPLTINFLWSSLSRAQPTAMPPHRRLHYRPRFGALVLLRRRPPERVDGFVTGVREPLHKIRLGRRPPIGPAYRSWRCRPSSSWPQ